jgi:lipoyl(octanoyl) transferase
VTEASGLPACEYAWLGRARYEEAWDLQKQAARERAEGSRPDTLFLLEHPPVYTTGRRDTQCNLRFPEELLGAPLVRTDRGGDITFHGPGQLIAYPIIDLRAARLGVVEYVRSLEETTIRTLRSYGIEAGVVCGLTGVWAGGEKIAAIGVRVSRPTGAGAWITTHGVALNVGVDLDWFARIIPCGIHDRGVTSMRALIGKPPPVAGVAGEFRRQFGIVFGRRMAALELPAALPAVRGRQI